MEKRNINEIIKRKELVCKVNEDSGKDYYAVEIELDTGYKTSIFFSYEQIELLKLTYSLRATKDMDIHKDFGKIAKNIELVKGMGAKSKKAYCKLSLTLVNGKVVDVFLSSSLLDILELTLEADSSKKTA